MSVYLYCCVIYLACKAYAPCDIVICGLPDSTIFSTLSHKRYDFRKEKVIEPKIYMFFSLQVLSETFLILRTIRRDIVMNVHRSSGKVPVVLVRF
jgi:hypothetical protein